jgi:hypothetical protein
MRHAAGLLAGGSAIDLRDLSLRQFVHGRFLVFVSRLNFRPQCCNSDAALQRGTDRYLTNAANIARNKK